MYLTTLEPDQAVFKRGGYGCTNVIPVIAGLCIMAVGIFIWSLAGIDSSAYIFAMVVVGLGILFLIGGLVLIPATYANTPKSITLNHAHGKVEVHVKNQTGYIPYSDIETFFVDPGGTAADPQSEFKACWAICMRKKDGEKWALTTYYKQAKAEQVVASLQQGLSRNPNATIYQRPELPRQVEVHEGAGKAMLVWRKPFSATTLYVIIFTMMFGVMTVQGTLKFTFLMIPFWIGTGLLAYMAIRLIQSHLRRFLISVDATQFNYHEFSKISGKQKKAVSMPTVDIDRLTYSFWTGNRGIGRFCIEPREGSAYKKIEFMLEGLNPAEALQLEGWLQLKMKEIGGVEVK